MPSRVLCHPLKNPISQLSFALCVTSAMSFACNLTSSMTSIAIAAVGLAALPFAPRYLLAKCVAIQKNEILRNRPDIVVGSSFGGAVAVELALTGAWTGPLLLLCPAHGKLSRYSLKFQTANLTSVTRQQQEKTLVVHGERDETISMSDSVALVEGSKAKLIRIAYAGHSLEEVPSEDLANWVRMTL